MKELSDFLLRWILSMEALIVSIIALREIHILAAKLLSPM